MLSIVNSVYDPLGLAVPVLLEGRLLLQQLVIMGKKNNNDMPLGWDDPLPETQWLQRQQWQGLLKELEKITVPRCYHTEDFRRITQAEIHVFSDASKDAIEASLACICTCVSLATKEKSVQPYCLGNPEWHQHSPLAYPV